MAVKLAFLGRLADIAGAPGREIDAPLDWSALVEALEGELGDWVAGDKVRVALNGTLLPEKAALYADEGDEVALLPPVSGG